MQKNQKKEKISWIIRFTPTETAETLMESKVGTRADVEKYAETKAKDRGSQYILS